MRRDPRSVVDHRIHAVAHVDEAAEASEPQHEEGKAGGEHHRTVPGKRSNPAEESPPAAQPAGNLHRGTDGEDSEQRWHHDKRGEAHLQEFKCVRLLRVHQQMMNPDRQAVDEEEDKCKPPHRIAIEAPAGCLRRHGVERDVSRDQPEIDDRVQRPREQSA